MKLLFELVCNRFGLGQFHRSGVAMYPVDKEFIVQVGAGGVTSGADRANGLALFDALAFAYLAFVEV